MDNLTIKGLKNIHNGKSPGDIKGIHLLKVNEIEIKIEKGGFGKRINKRWFLTKSGKRKIRKK